MEKQINEELRQYKLFKIQETEAKLRRFKGLHSEIKETNTIKITKNVSSNVLRVGLLLSAVFFLILTILCFFPDIVVDFFDKRAIDSSIDFYYLVEFLKYIFLPYAFFLFFTAHFLRLNYKKRNKIHSSSILLEEVMIYLEKSAKDDKKKYEYFVDSLAEIEQMKK